MFRNIALPLRLCLGGLASGLLLVAACGDDDNGNGNGNGVESIPTVAATPTPAEPAGAETIEVTAVDYAFQGLSDTVETGTMVTLVNESDVEAHELVAIRLPDDETRPVSELIQLPDEEIPEIVNTEPTMVLISAPGEEGMAVVGDGTFTEPGRYAVFCFIPVGADPAVVLDPMAEGPPEGEAPPHAAQGMFAEVTVE